MNKHTFAFFYPELSTKALTFQEGAQIFITEPAMISRMVHVLRLSSGDQCMFFDTTIELLCIVDTLSKKNIACTIVSLKQHKREGVEVTVLLPLLKKEDFDSSLYALGAVGVEHIQLITTEKTQRTWNKDKDMHRSEHILIAAAEQSKYFSIPTVHEPQPLLKVLDAYTSQAGVKVVADPAGKSIDHFICSYSDGQKVVMLVGPEGGLAEKELAYACQAGFISYRLTPTILKAEHAIIIMSGLFRSICAKI